MTKLTQKQVTNCKEQVKKDLETGREFWKSVLKKSKGSKDYLKRVESFSLDDANVGKQYINDIVHNLHKLLANMGLQVKVPQTYDSLMFVDVKTSKELAHTDTKGSLYWDGVKLTNAVQHMIEYYRNVIHTARNTPVIVLGEAQKEA